MAKVISVLVILSRYYSISRYIFRLAHLGAYGCEREKEETRIKRSLSLLNVKCPEVIDEVR